MQMNDPSQNQGLQNSNSGVFSKSQLHTPRRRNSSMQQGPPQKTIDFDYSDFTNLDQKIM